MGFFGKSKKAEPVSKDPAPIAKDVAKPEPVKRSGTGKIQFAEPGAEVHTSAPGGLQRAPSGKIRFGGDATTQQADAPIKRQLSRKAQEEEKAGNLAEVFRMETAVYENRVMAVQARCLVQENAALIRKNFSSAFNGNRQLTDQNTDDLFRNRMAVVASMPADPSSSVQLAYAEAMSQKEKIAHLRHRASLDKQSLDITQ